jgi:hypothetical protein
MKHERSTRSEHLDRRTLPDGTAAQSSSQPLDANADSHTNEPAGPGEERDKNFWRFDFHTIPPDLSRELATAQLPPVREEQLYQSKALRNTSASPEAPRPSGVAGFVARVRAWSAGPWYLRERRTQIALVFCVACLVLFVIAVGVGSNERARAVPRSVGPTQVYAASPVARAPLGTSRASQRAGMHASPSSAPSAHLPVETPRAKSTPAPLVVDKAEPPSTKLNRPEVAGRPPAPPSSPDGGVSSDATIRPSLAINPNADVSHTESPMPESPKPSASSSGTSRPTVKFYLPPQ